MNLRKAAEMALEVLENPWSAKPEGVADAIEALRKALAQPEQEPECIGVIGNLGRVEWSNGVFPQLGDRLYTAPPKRKLVGLTDEELNDAMKYWSDKERSAYGGARSADNEYFDVKDSWRYIEAKLKEKNG